MNITVLTDIEVKRLIKSVKLCQKQIPNETPLIGRIKDDTPVIDFKNHISYQLHRYRHPIDNSRFSLHIRFKDTNEHLIRIDINNGSHLNPDKTRVAQNHMHIYHYDENKVDDKVIKLFESEEIKPILFSERNNYIKELAK